MDIGGIGLKDMAGVGCYDTSIVTVIATALANRSPAAPPLTGRTRQFDAVEPGKDKAGNAIPKIVKQLELEYHFARTHQQQRVVQKTNVVQPLYFHEVVADLAGKRIRQNCDLARPNIPRQSATVLRCPEVDAVLLRNSLNSDKAVGACETHLVIVRVALEI